MIKKINNKNYFSVLFTLSNTLQIDCGGNLGTIYDRKDLDMKSSHDMWQKPLITVWHMCVNTLQKSLLLKCSTEDLRSPSFFINEMIGQYSRALSEFQAQEIAPNQQSVFSYSPISSNITPHVCRHTYCRNMAKSIMDPKTLLCLLGHLGIIVTISVYTYLVFDDINDENNT